MPVHDKPYLKPVSFINKTSMPVHDKSCLKPVSFINKTSMPVHDKPCLKPVSFNLQVYCMVRVKRNVAKYYIN